MSNVNTRIQDFYHRGYGDGVAECVNFMRHAASRFGKTQPKDDHTVGDLYRAMATVLEEHFGAKPATNDGEAK